MPDNRPPARRNPPRRGGFRADIQGMRALAVLAIIAFHAGFSPYPGGFVTLDVFFVISGFLITQLLLREVQRSGTLSLRGFYRRRALRILPAASVAAVVTVVGSYLWLDLVAAKDAAIDALWAALFGANVRFARENTDYFSADEAPSPFQHFWSLSLEEQFYAGLPLLLLGCVALVRRWQRRGIATASTPARTMFLAVVLVTAASFAWSLHASTASPETAYFSTFTRTWEFGVGAIIAITADRLVRSWRDSARNLLALAGLTAIAVGAFVVTPATPYPGHMALLPVLGTGAVVIAGAGLADRPPPLLQRALGTAPLRLVGDASYSLYLWHWPVLILADARLGREPTTIELAAIIAVIFAVSFASYRWVETPFRRGNPLRFRSDLALYPVAVSMVASYSVVAIALVHQGVDTGGKAITPSDYAVQASDPGPKHRNRPGQEPQPDRDPAVVMVEASARAAAENAEVPADLTPGLLDLSGDQADLGACDYRETGARDLCPRGGGGEKTLVLLGDSHGQHWIPALERITERTGHTAYYLIMTGCSAAQDANNSASGIGDHCADFNQWARQQVAKLKPDLTLISTTSPGRVARGGEESRDPGHVRNAFRAGFANLLGDVRPHSKRVAVIGDTPARTKNVAECLGGRNVRLGDCAEPPERQANRDMAVTRAVARKRNIDFVSTTRWFCAEGRCPAVIGDAIAMRDQSHVTTTYAARLAEPLGEALGLTERESHAPRRGAQRPAG